MINELTELVFILDESGSMESYANGTLECVNRGIKEQREKNKKTKVTMCLFSTRYKTIFNNVDITEVEPLTHENYRVEGGTALLDAIGITLTSVMLHYETIPKNDRPKNVNIIVLILTDDQENSSHIYNFDKIKRMIDNYKKEYSWKFVFIGADIDAIAEAAKINIEANNSYQVDRSDPNWVNNCVYMLREAFDD